MDDRNQEGCEQGTGYNPEQGIAYHSKMTHFDKEQGSMVDKNQRE